MVQHVFSAICRRVIQDAPTDLVSLIDCVQHVNVPEGARPNEVDGVLLPVDITIFTTWIRADRDQPASGVGRVMLVLPDGNSLHGREFPIDLSKTSFFRAGLPIAMHPFTTPGRYQHLVELRRDDGSWHEVARASRWSSS